MRLRQYDPVVFTATIAGSLEQGALSGGAEKGEKGHVIEVYPDGYTIEVTMDEEGRGRLVDVKEGQVRLDWQTYWTPERIKKLRSERGLTQKEMGGLIWEGTLATARKNYANLERGATAPSASVARTLRRLEDELDHVPA